MKYFLFFMLIFCSFLCNTAISGRETESREELAEKVIRASQFSEFSDTTMIVYFKAIARQVDQYTSQEEHDRISLKVRQDVQSAALDFYEHHGIKERLKALYLESFSDEELKQLIRFYNSDLGQRFMHVYPVVENMNSEIREEFIDTYLESEK